MKKSFVLKFSGFQAFEDFQILFFQMFIMELPLNISILFIILFFLYLVTFSYK